MNAMISLSADLDPSQFASGLPTAAAEKLRRLADAAEDFHGGLEAISEKIHGRLLPQRQHAAETMSMLNKRLVEGDPRLTAAQKELAAVDGELTRAKDVEAFRAARWRQANRSADRCRRYVQANAATELNAVAVPSVKLARSETWADAVDRLRLKIADVKKQIDITQLAPVPSAENISRVRTIVDNMAAAGRPDIFAMVEGNGGVRWPTIDAAAEVHAVTTGGHTSIGRAHLQTIDVTGLMAYLFRDKLIEALEAEVLAMSDDGKALSAADKRKRIEELQAQCLDLEFQEESVIEAAEGVGIVIPRRDDVDPRAVLGITGPAMRD